MMSWTKISCAEFAEADLVPMGIGLMHKLIARVSTLYQGQADPVYQLF